MNEGMDQGVHERVQSTVDCQEQTASLFLREGAKGRAWLWVPFSVLVPQGQSAALLELPWVQVPVALGVSRDPGVKGLGRGRRRSEHMSRSAGWRTCSSTALCTCSSLPGVTLPTLRKSSSRSATLSLVSVLWGALMVLGEPCLGRGKGCPHLLQHRAPWPPRPAPPSPTPCAPRVVTLRARMFSSWNIQG